MACPHVSSIKLPDNSSRVHKEECTKCFYGQDHAEGVNICLTCFNAGCSDGYNNHAAQHAQQHSHPLVVNLKRQGEPPKKLTRVAIGGEGGASMGEKEYEFTTEVRCFSCSSDPTKPVAIQTDSMDPSLAVAMILDAKSSHEKDDIKAWEVHKTACDHTQFLVQQDGAKHITTKEKACCSECDKSDNLWLCMTCGSLGCGRKMFDGSGGNGHAKTHAEKHGHNVVLKLGTITPEGTADVYCYGCDDERIDPHLEKHLLHFGVKIAEQEKTEKTISEMEVARNNQLDFTTTVQDGKTLIPLFGPHHLGLQNLGNTCYLNSTVQALAACPGFRMGMSETASSHTNCSKDPANCLICQEVKLFNAVESGEFSKAPNMDAFESLNDEDRSQALISGQEGVSPHMLKYVVAGNNADFASNEQQCAAAWLRHLADANARSAVLGNSDPLAALQFEQEDKYTCTECKKVRIVTSSQIHATVGLPTTGEKSLSEALMETYGGSEVIDDFQCSQCNGKTKVIKSQRFSTYPEVLAIQVNRFSYENWVPTKLDTDLPVPDYATLKSCCAIGLLPGESEMSEEAGTKVEADVTIVSGLMAMGFGENRCKRAALAVNNSDVEAAATWLFGHMDDESLDLPIDTSGNEPAAEMVANLIELGFAEGHCKNALKNTNNDPDRAVEWLFSHPDEAVEEKSALKSQALPAAEDPRHSYHLVSFVSHRGQSVNCGHYVAHTKSDAHKWVLFNDQKVAASPDATPNKAYLLFLQRSN